MCLPNHNVAAFRGAVAFPHFFSSFLPRSCSPQKYTVPQVLPVPFVSAAELISQLLLGLCFGFSRGPLQLCRPAHRFESFYHPTTVISHLKHSRPLIDHRCQHSGIINSSILQNNGARKAKMDIFLHVLLDWGHSAQQDQSAARQELEASPGFLLRSTMRSPCTSHPQCNNRKWQHQDASFFL